MRSLFIFLLVSATLIVSGCVCSSDEKPSVPTTVSPRIGQEALRGGDEIVVAGRRFHTGAPVVLWTDPGGYDAYRVQQRFASPADLESGHELDGTPRYNTREGQHDDAEFAAKRAGDWTLDELREVVDQFVVHYDVCGTSRTCFRVLHDMRGLSVHFMLDVDGTIYQTLDVKERAWHATKANHRSIGIEIANIGAYSRDNAAVLNEWYTRDDAGTRMTLPPRFGDGGIRTQRFIARPAQPDPVQGRINGRELIMYDLTPEQYDSLAKLIATLNVALPKITIDAPRHGEGRIADAMLSDNAFDAFSGVLGHYHVQAGKVDPGPAFDWERVLRTARVVRDQQNEAPRD